MSNVTYHSAIIKGQMPTNEKEVKKKKVEEAFANLFEEGFGLNQLVKYLRANKEKLCAYLNEKNDTGLTPKDFKDEFFNGGKIVANATDWEMQYFVVNVRKYKETIVKDDKGNEDIKRELVSITYQQKEVEGKVIYVKRQFVSPKSVINAIYKLAK